VTVASFSATDACVEGFRVARRHPWSMLVWGLFFVVAMILGFALMGSLGLMSAMTPGAMNPGALNNPANPTAAMTNALKIDAVFLPFSLIATTMLLCAIFRATLRPEDKGVAYLKIGGDELRVFVVVVVMTILGLVAEAVVAGVLMVAVGVVYKANNIAGVLAGVIATVGFVCLAVWVVVRLSLAYAQTFAEKRIRIFGSWALTRGRFWPLFGMYALTALICLGVLIALYIVIIIVMIAGMGPAIASAAQGHTADFSTAGPMVIVALVLAFLVSVVGFSLIYTILYAPQAAAYRQLTAGDKAAEAF
jgi:flagellar biogenesis protein FliO